MSIKPRVVIVPMTDQDIFSFFTAVRVLRFEKLQEDRFVGHTQDTRAMSRYLIVEAIIFPIPALRASLNRALNVLSLKLTFPLGKVAPRDIIKFVPLFSPVSRRQVAFYPLSFPEKLHRP